VCPKACLSFCNFLESRFSNNITGINKKITPAPSVELFVIYNYRSKTRILSSELQIFLLSLFSWDGNRWWMHQGQILISAAIM